MFPDPYCLEFPCPRPRSAHARELARAFALPTRRGKAQRRPGSPLARALLPAPGQIHLILGPSGSGKSSLLRAIRTVARRRILDLDTLDFPDAPLCDALPGLTLDQTLAQLNRFGLGEVWTYLRSPWELSAGQLWRFRLALAIHRARSRRQAPIIVSDEFTSLLDRITAIIIARSLRRAIVPQRSAVVATAHDDIVDALQPNAVIECDFGRVTVHRPVLG
jgi:ABC-type ATPase with predicted acetyltransferase domain